MKQPVVARSSTDIEFRVMAHLEVGRYTNVDWVGSIN